ncbi:MAG: TetR/AcrR family transcriptional regulator [Leptolyngbyaceae cyanobacterium RU_5_1]|nr:TetR/AcrR family transcriptional regulator [Leptolyngbyaceae cyanobacterium RU_5_1]
MKKGETTKLDILQQAAPIFNQQGYAGASIANVMAATGLQKGGIYNHFESKEQLALETFSYSVRLVRQHYAEALQDQTSAPDQLLAFMAVFQQFFHDSPIPGGCPLLNTAIESDDAFPALREQASREMKQWHSWIVRIIRGGINRSEIRSSIDAKATATLLIACLEGGLMLSKLHNDPIYLQQAIAHLQAYIASALRA